MKWDPETQYSIEDEKFLNIVAAPPGFRVMLLVSPLEDLRGGDPTAELEVRAVAAFGTRYTRTFVYHKETSALVRRGAWCRNDVVALTVDSELGCLELPAGGVSNVEMIGVLDPGEDIPEWAKERLAKALKEVQKKPIAKGS